MKKLLVVMLAAPLIAGSCLPEITKAPKSGTRPVPDPVSRFVGISGTTAPFDYTLNPIEAYQGDTIRFAAPASFDVDFGIDGPTDRRQVSGGAGDTVLVVIRLAAPPGTYKYSVTLRIGRLLITDDPRLIVRED